jgi:hypothetical protein
VRDTIKPLHLTGIPNFLESVWKGRNDLDNDESFNSEDELEGDPELIDEIMNIKPPNISRHGILIHPAIRRDLEGDRGPTFFKDRS